jgi:hypothetical protein
VLWVRAPPFDLNPNAFGILHDLNFFDPDAGGHNPIVGQGKACDLLREGLDQIDMPGANERLDALDQGFVIHDVFQPIAERLATFLHRQVNIDPYGLAAALFVPMNPDFSLNDEIAHKDVAHAVLGVGKP